MRLGLDAAHNTTLNRFLRMRLALLRPRLSVPPLQKYKIAGRAALRLAVVVRV